MRRLKISIGKRVTSSIKKRVQERNQQVNKSSKVQVAETRFSDYKQICLDV